MLILKICFNIRGLNLIKYNLAFILNLFYIAKILISN